MENVSGYLHSAESAGTLDGPGVRRVLFLQGCPLNCLYCHNPDARPFRCGEKTDAFTQLREIARYRDLFQRTGGGVTLSGGEPLSQPAFVKAIFEGCRKMGVHTALDTSGYTGWRADDELLSYTNLVLLDIKHIRPENYRNLTGVELEPTLIFARRLAELGVPVWLRHVLVPGYTDQSEHLAELAAFAATLPNIERVDILPFHNMGSYKWEQLGRTYALANTPEPTPEQVAEAQGVFRDAGLVVF